MARKNKPEGDGTVIATRRKKKGDPPLIFIDTNILLDFYRSRKDAGLDLLGKIDGLHDIIITSCQIEMEFKKNRQKVIHDAMGQSTPQLPNIQVPAFLREAANVKAINKANNAHRNNIEKRLEKIDKRLLKTLCNPTTQDKVYKTAQRLFSHTGPLNLKRDTAEYRRVWRSALRRFLEGRPPRKDKDFAIGDSINWEWIVECVKKTNRDVVIISSDSDYGLISRYACEANTCLVEELKQRCNQQRKLILVDRLSSALKLVNVVVKPTEVESEMQIISDSKRTKTEGLLRTLRRLPREPLDDALFRLLEDSISDLVNSDPVAEEIACTNASGWGLDIMDVEDVGFEDDQCVATVSFSFCGDQDDDKPWCGTTITGQCVASIDKNGRVTISDVTAERDLGSDDDEISEPLPLLPELEDASLQPLIKPESEPESPSAPPQ